MTTKSVVLVRSLYIVTKMIISVVMSVIAEVCYLKWFCESLKTQAVNRSRTDNTAVKKGDKITNIDLQSTTHKITIEKINTNLTKNNRGELRCSGRVGSSCSTSGTRRVTQSCLVMNEERTDL